MSGVRACILRPGAHTHTHSDPMDWCRTDESIIQRLPVTRSVPRHLSLDYDIWKRRRRPISCFEMEIMANVAVQDGVIGGLFGKDSSRHVVTVESAGLKDRGTEAVVRCVSVIYRNYLVFRLALNYKEFKW